MHLAYRVLDPAGSAARYDLAVDAPDSVTVGGLADALARHLGCPAGRTLRSTWPRADAPLPRDRPAAEAGPMSGSTVELVRTSGAAAVSPLPSAPTRLVSADGDVALHYGGNRPAGTHGVVVHVATSVTVRAEGAAALRVNGSTIWGEQTLAHGDLLTAGDSSWVLDVDGDLDPPPDRGATVRWTSTPAPPRSTDALDVDLPAPPAPVRTPGFPWMSAAVPLLMGAALWYATRSVVSVAFVGFSVVFVVASGWEARREARAEDRFRVARFRAELDRRLAAAARRDEQRSEHLRRITPDPCELVGPVGPSGSGTAGWHRLWERSGTAPRPTEPGGPPGPHPDVTTGLLRVSLGEGIIGPLDRLMVPDGGREELRTELHRGVEEHRGARGPVIVDLATTGGLCIVGSGSTPSASARHLVAQLAVSVPPTEMALHIVAAPHRRTGWRWTAWLPHRREPRPGPGPVRVVVADGVDDAVLADALGRWGHRTEMPPPILIRVSTTAAGRPRGVTGVLRLDPGGEATLEVDGDPAATRRSIRPVTLEVDEAEPLARRMGPLRAAVPVRVPGPAAGGAPGDTDDLPDSVRLAHLLDDADALTDARRILELWRRCPPGAPVAAVGVGPGGGIATVDLGSDGPHALVAGTTGAGKSELLRTLLVTTALHHPPRDVTFLLVDYKGGAAFGDLVELPHTVGLITDLSGDLARRALVSLRAEVRRREEVLAGAAATDIVDAQRCGVALPSLVVVVDEFATLASELPDFVDGLVDVARRGRSLGLHLVLATQRPAGVVTDQIRANTSLRLCLRVADHDDSRDVVGVPDAASIPPGLPGRAVVRAGPDVSRSIQVAWTGGPLRRGETVEVTPLHAPTPPTSTAADDTAADPGGAATELSSAVASLRAAADELDDAPPRRPWRPALPPKVDAHDVAEVIAEVAEASHDGVPGSPAVAIGIVDRPDLQARHPLTVDLARSGGLLVLGASGSGRSTTVRTLAEALDADRATCWHLHVVDGGGTLGDLARRGAVGDVLAVADLERSLRLLGSLEEEMQRRLTGEAGAADPAPRRVVVVDGWAAFEETHERVGRGLAVDLLVRIAREGRAVGCHVVVTATRRSEVPGSLAAALGRHLQLRCSTPDEAALAGVDGSWADPDLPPGRCLVDGRTAQVARTGTARDGRRHHPPARTVPRLPRLVRLEGLDASDDGGAPGTGTRWQLPVGMQADGLTTARFDLGQRHGLVAGPPGSGCSTALATLAAAFRRGEPTGVVVDEPRMLAEVADALGAATGADPVSPTLVLVDELHRVVDDHGLAAAVQRLCRLGRDQPVRVVAAGEVDQLLRCYDDLVATFRGVRNAVLLGEDPDPLGVLAHVEIPRAVGLPGAPGRGWILSGSRTAGVQVAVADPDAAALSSSP